MQMEKVRSWRQAPKAELAKKNKKINFYPDWLRGRRSPTIQDFRDLMDQTNNGEEIETDTWKEVI